MISIGCDGLRQVVNEFDGLRLLRWVAMEYDEMITQIT